MMAPVTGTCFMVIPDEAPVTGTCFMVIPDDGPCDWNMFYGDT